MKKLITALCSLLLLSGCATYGVIENAPQQHLLQNQKIYSIAFYASLDTVPNNDISISLAFSGGGTRAAAFSYGVLQALREKHIMQNGRAASLLDDVDIISSVSGGSFTAAYYGLYGNRIFEDFKHDFLLQDIESHLISGLHDPATWFNNRTRTELAVEYFDRIMFRGATFNDMLREGSPFIIINASDLGDGVRLSFTQEYFNLLCSDLSSFPVSRAVTASAAVPVIFSPIVIRNYPGCLNGVPKWLTAAKERFQNNSEMMQVLDGLQTYLDKEKRKFIHLVDGGVTDNLGLRSLYEIMEFSGGAKQFMRDIERQPPRRVVIIVVDAATRLEPLMDSSALEPSLDETVNALTDAQLHRYSAATLQLIEQKQAEWAKELSGPGQPVIPYFINLRFKDLQSAEKLKLINRIPTSFSLTPEQVEALVEAAAELLNSNPEFQRLLNDLSKESAGRL